MKNKFYIVIFLFVLFLGCQTASSDKNIKNPDETTQDMHSAIEAVVDVMTTNEIKIKYCPVCGKRFSPSVETCPYDGATLRLVE